MYAYEDTSTWFEQYGKSLGRVFPNEYKSFLKKNQYAFSDIPSDHYDDLAEDFWQNYSSIKAFHGCRILDESSYRESGIEPLYYPRVEELLVKLISESRFGEEISLDEIVAVIEEYRAPVREGRVFLALDCRHLQKGGGNGFITNGSEFVFLCLLKLIGRKAALAILNNYGRKCIISCLLPLERFNSETLGSLCFNTLGSFIETAMNLSPDLYCLDFSLSPNHVTPSEILDFDYQ